MSGVHVDVILCDTCCEETDMGGVAETFRCGDCVQRFCVCFDVSRTEDPRTCRECHEAAAREGVKP